MGARYQLTSSDDKVQVSDSRRQQRIVPFVQFQSTAPLAGASTSRYYAPFVNSLSLPSTVQSKKQKAKPTATNKTKKPAKVAQKPNKTTKSSSKKPTQRNQKTYLSADPLV